MGCRYPSWLPSWLASPDPLIVTGIDVGVVGPSMGAAVMGSVPPERGGMAAGSMTTFRQLGQTLGVAVLGVVPTAPQGIDGVYLTAGAIAAVAGVLALAIRPVPAPAPA